MIHMISLYKYSKSLSINTKRQLVRGWAEKKYFNGARIMYIVMAIEEGLDELIGVPEKFNLDYVFYSESEQEEEHDDDEDIDSENDDDDEDIDLQPSVNLEKTDYCVRECCYKYHLKRCQDKITCVYE